MTDRRLGRPLLTAFAASLILTGSAVTFAAAPPKPPSRICLNDSCPPAKPAATARAIKWHPGHYTWIGGSVPDDSHMAEWFRQIDSICTDTNIKGVQLLLRWGTLEQGTTPGNYTFEALDKLIAKLASCNKKLMFGILDKEYGRTEYPGPTPNRDSYARFYPLYLLQQETYGNGALHGVVFQAEGEWHSSTKSMPRLWDAAVMDRLIALVKALGTRYDTNRVLETFIVETVSISQGALDAGGVKYDTWFTQYKRLLSAASAAWPHTIVRTKGDWVLNATYGSQFIDYCLSLTNCAMGQDDPEMPLPNLTNPPKTYKGQLMSTIFRGVEGGGPDHRGKIAWIAEVQDTGLGSRGYTYDPADIHAFFHDYVHATHEVWLWNTYAGGPAQQWKTGIRPFIDSIKGDVYSTECPSRYGSCDTK